MVQLKILSGKKAGVSWMARRFPARIGRSPSADFQLEENGVWDEHLQLDCQPGEGFSLSVAPRALATVNGQSISQTLLRNGDVSEMGSLKMQFWLSATRQPALALREWLTWTAIGLICLGQIGLIYWLVR